MSEWTNGWTLTYVGICAVLLVALRASGQASPIVRWRRVTAWLGLAAVVGLVVWSALACAVLGLLEGQPNSWDWKMVPYCLLGSAFWASFVIGAFVPLYGLILFWYARRFATAEGTRRSIVLASLLLSLPGTLWITYGFAFPVYDLHHAVNEGATYGSMALVSFWTALSGPRLIVHRLGPGQLLERVAA